MTLMRSFLVREDPLSPSVEVLSVVARAVELGMMAAGVMGRLSRAAR